MAKKHYRADFVDVDPYLRFTLDVKDILFIDEIYSTYNADVPFVDAFGDYVQNVLDPKYDQYHPLYVVMSYDTTNNVFDGGDILGIASDLGSVCNPDEIDIAKMENGKGSRTCIVEFHSNYTFENQEWPPTLNDANIEYTSRVGIHF